MENKETDAKNAKEKNLVEFLNGIVNKVQRFTDDKLDKLEEKFNEYIID